MRLGFNSVSSESYKILEVSVEGCFAISDHSNSLSLAGKQEGYGKHEDVAVFLGHG